MTVTAVLFFVAFAAGCLLALFRHPVFGGLTYIAVVFLDPPSRWWGEVLPDLRWSMTSAMLTLVGIMLLGPKQQSIPIGKQQFYVLLLMLIGWACIQLPWVLDWREHMIFLNYYFKYAVAIYLVYRCFDSHKHFKWLLWAYVLGCAYLAYVAHTSFTGERFDGFGGAGIGEANAGALTLVTGVFIASSLFLYSGTFGRVVLGLIIPFLLNSLVMTVSRSGFLALAVGGIAFIWFTPGRYRLRVIGLSILGVIGFALLTNQFYWERMETVKYQGRDVEGVDTGGARRDLLFAQVRMWKHHPLGCGHMCTEFLSPSYIGAGDLNVDIGRRSSHNTFMSLLVDHGPVGAIFYVMTLVWVYKSLKRLRAEATDSSQLLLMLLPGVSGAIAALTISDQFIPNVKYEPRFWLATMLMLMLSFLAASVGASNRSEAAPTNPTPAR